ncbi:MAG: 50S ribosomal protein L21 [Pelagibacteraceae bacterium]|jgi:large subunit ribosomal protein L21|nr:50S ribosomal protein L21 [Pelagibacteraceae bacterium]RZO89107.1 MAG: 50S ribosomal protein L21 [alpha proteobacterium HIMB114]|tara:strand:- start:2684 stop:3073 length:390 start_codon:yes stop_codon:yes gene_type:complete
MTFAVINTGGKQYKVTTNDKLRIEKLSNEEGKSILFDKVLLINDNQNMELGSPLIEGAKVEAKIVKQTKNKTVLIFKKRRRHNSRRKNGHRQKMSVVQITKIFGKGGKLLSESNKNENKKVKTTTKKSA